MTKNQAYIIKMMTDAGGGILISTGKRNGRERTIKSLFRRGVIKSYLCTGCKIAAWFDKHPGYEMAVTGQNMFGNSWNIVRKEGPLALPVLP